jgi:hypothetical protein
VCVCVCVCVHVYMCVCVCILTQVKAALAAHPKVKAVVDNVGANRHKFSKK